MKVLVTGCCGYIGSHTCVELIKAGYEVVGLDNFSNSKKDVLDRIFMITNEEIKFYEGDMQNIEILRRIFSENKITSVIDFAAYKAVGESVSKPIEYYMNNVSSVLNLLKAMKEYGVKNLVFSSSATVYGDPKVIPITEDCPTGGTTNPYGTSKLFVEQILKDCYASDNTNDFCILRYFNPIGAHDSGLLGENPNGIPANLMPYICRVASKKLEKEKQGLYIYNLGMGKGVSVLEMIETFKKVNKVDVPYKIVERRPGDIAKCYSDSTKAFKELGFTCEKTLEDMVQSAWNYEHKNIN